MNKQAHFEELRVYGVLTNLKSFEFYSYDPTNKLFSLDGTVTVSSNRDMLMEHMIPGM